MKTATKSATRSRNRLLLPLALAAAALVAAAPATFAGERAGVPASNAMGASANANVRHLFYLPSRAPSVDHAANVDALAARGFSVHVMEQADESDRAYILRVRDEIRALLDQGVAPSAITVLGSGRGSQATALVSVATGNRYVNYVMLGRCDARMAQDPYFRMSGRLLGLRDADDRSSGSCRPLWRNSRKATQRHDVVVRTGLGASLFDAPHEAWMQPVAEWSSGGRVDLGEVNVAARRGGTR